MSNGLKMTGEERAALDEQIRTPIRAALHSGAASYEDVQFLLARMLGELAVSCGHERDEIIGHVFAAYDLASQRAKEN